MGGEKHPAPRVINTDKHAAYPPAIAELKADGVLDENSKHRPVQYLNNILEQDHRAIRRRVREGVAEVAQGMKRSITTYPDQEFSIGQANACAAEKSTKIRQRDFVLYPAARKLSPVPRERGVLYS